jgi:hypothetical protein
VNRAQPCFILSLIACRETHLIHLTQQKPKPFSLGTRGGSHGGSFFRLNCANDLWISYQHIVWPEAIRMEYSFLVEFGDYVMNGIEPSLPDDYLNLTLMELVLDRISRNSTHNATHEPAEEARAFFFDIYNQRIIDQISNTWISDNPSQEYPAQGQYDETTSRA